MSVYSAHDVAAEIRRRLPGVPAKKLHKLLYYSQGHHAAAFGGPLFGENIEAWDRGPVVATLWREEKYGSAHSGSERRRLDQAALNTVGYVVSRYGSITGADLEALTHGEAPWRLADERRRLTDDQQMPLAEIRAFFVSVSSESFDADLDDAEDGYGVPAAAVASWLADAPTRAGDKLSVDDLDELRRIARS